MKGFPGVLLVLFPSLLLAVEEARNIRIVSDRCPDFYSTKTMVQSVTKGLKTDREKVIAIYDLMRSMVYHWQYPAEKGRHVGTLKLLNVYGWTLCGGQASCLITMYQDLGYETHYRGWSSPGHTTMEVKYGGKWHWVDTFLKLIPFKPNGEIAGQEEIKADPSIVLRLQYDSSRQICWYPEDMPRDDWDAARWRRAHPMLLCRDSKEGCVQGCRNSRVTGWGGTGTRDRDGYKTDVDLRPGMSLKLRWEADPGGWYTARNRKPGHSCGTRDFRNDPIIGPKLEPYGRRTWANGDLVFEPDLSKGRAVGFDRASGGVYVVTMKSPFVVAHADVQAEGRGEVKIDVQSRFGKREGLSPGQLPDEIVRGVYQYVLTVRCRKLTKLRVHSLIQHNRCTRPFLLPGKNVWTVSVDRAPRRGKVTVEVAYKPRFHTKSLKARWKSGESLYTNKHVKEAPRPVVKSVTLKGNKGRIEFDVPSDNTDDPAYPRMLYILYRVDPR